MSHKEESSLKRKRQFQIGADMLEVTPLGAGHEVGRSCIVVKFKNKSIMMDCGIHPAFTGIASLPFFDEIQSSEIDILLITHFHLDHIAALPYFVEKTNFKGQIFMTPPTKAIYYLLMQDYVRVTSNSEDSINSNSLFDSNDLANSLNKIQLIEYNQTIQIKGMKITCFNAGHVLGAAMFQVEIAGVKFLYTGDFSLKPDRHLNSAYIPKTDPPDLLIMESTYGIQTLTSPLERETQFLNYVAETLVKKGGKVLIPVFALGRAQELLLILDEYWQKNKNLLSHIPIYYASSLAKKCMPIFMNYSHMMSKNIQEKISNEHMNPFDFSLNKNITFLTDTSHFYENKPCVLIASPGMLQSGISREFFDLWAPDPKNGVIIPGYCVEGTLAKLIMSEPSTFVTLDGKTLPLKCDVHYVSFSAHADYADSSEFIESLRPPYIILVHGDVNEMIRLKNAIEEKYSDGSVKVSTPNNCQSVQLEFHTEKVAKLMGSLATASNKDLDNGTIISGVIVKKDFNQMIIAPSELSQFSPLTSTVISQSLTIPFYGSFSTLCSFLTSLFEIEIIKSASDETIKENTVNNNSEDVNSNNFSEAILIYESIKISYPSSHDHVLLEWEANPLNDMIADSIITLLMTAQTSFASVKIAHDGSANDPRLAAQRAEKDRLSKSKVEEIESKVLSNAQKLSDKGQFLDDVITFLKSLMYHAEDSDIDSKSSITILDKDSSIIQIVSENFTAHINTDTGNIDSVSGTIPEHTHFLIEKIINRLNYLHNPLSKNMSHDNMEIENIN